MALNAFFFPHCCGCFKKQIVVSRSSTKAEYRALADTIYELIWLRWLLQDMEISQSNDTNVYCDNYSVIQIAHNDLFHECTKHIEIDCYFIRHQLVHGTLQISPLSCLHQDSFTQPVS